MRMIGLKNEFTMKQNTKLTGDKLLEYIKKDLLKRINWAKGLSNGLKIRSEIQNQLLKFFCDMYSVEKIQKMINFSVVANPFSPDQIVITPLNLVTGCIMYGVSPEVLLSLDVSSEEIEIKEGKLKGCKFVFKNGEFGYIPPKPLERIVVNLGLKE